MQRPHPPILIGGGGPRVLSIAARQADIVGINGNMRAGVIGPDAVASMTRDVVATNVALVREAAGARIDEIELNIRAFMVSVTDDRAGALRGSGRDGRRRRVDDRCHPVRLDRQRRGDRRAACSSAGRSSGSAT